MGFVEIRKKAGYFKQENLAVDLKIDRTTIGKWETGKAKPKLDMVPELARLLNVSIEEIVLCFA